jgi:xylan 1,4-beta-xylosidase
MQSMTWTMSRLGSRFNLLFEPYKNRVMHSAMGRFLDRPLDLMVGLIEPDGTHRVLPFTTRGVQLANPEQFERMNSITFRGYSEKHNLRFEFNVHAVFYPQDERLCIMPAFYLEMRVNPVHRIRWHPEVKPPQKVKLFIRLGRPDTTICASPDADASPASIDLAYSNPLTPRNDQFTMPPGVDDAPKRSVQVRERIVSLNPGCEVTDCGQGLVHELPVTDAGSGVKWRLVWGAHVAEPVLKVLHQGESRDAAFRYNNAWASLDDVIDEAVDTRDQRLALSRRFEKLLEQTPIDTAQSHLLAQSFQAWLSNTFWCDLKEDGGHRAEWFGVWEGSCAYLGTLDVEYNIALLYLTLWPKLLGMQFAQWAEQEKPHEPSAGSFLSHDLGAGVNALGQAYPHDMEVEENCNFLLLLQAYTHWTGRDRIAKRRADLVARLARYLIWSDRDGSGFPSQGVANTIDDASPAVQFARKQTYLAVKRLAALKAAADLLTLADADTELARRCDSLADDNLKQVEATAWLGDHYGVCVDKSAVGVLDAWTGKPLPFDTLPGWDAYSIYTGNGLLLPFMVGRPDLLDHERLRTDIANSQRENATRYGCGHTSAEADNVWISQNLWRDSLAQYIGLRPMSPQYYWDMQVMSNTGPNSMGYIDTYINNYLSFNPRGIAVIGHLIAAPRLVIDRLAPGGAYITVEPDRHKPQRWPLLPLADWTAGKIPVCVIDHNGRVTIEGQIDPVIVHGPQPDPDATPSGTQLIG